MNAGSNNREPILIRQATFGDRATILRLAALDSAPPPHGLVLFAEVAGDARAAIEVETGRVVADPFRRTAEVVQLLTIRAAQIEASLTSRDDARGRHHSSHRRANGRGAGRQDDRTGRRAQPSLAPSHAGA